MRRRWRKATVAGIAAAFAVSAVAATASATTEPAEEDTEPAEEGTEPAEEGTAPEAPAVEFPMTPGDDWPETLVFTLTPSQEAGGLIETAEPLAALLSERLGVDVEPFVPTDYAGVIVALESGQAHVAGGLGPVQMVQAEDEAGAELILQSERRGEFEYVTQWFTNDPDTYCEDEPVALSADDPAFGLAALLEGSLFCNGVQNVESFRDGPIGDATLANAEGASVAFVSQGSASGYLVPALQLLQAGVDPVDDIEETFAGGHDNAVRAVYDGDAEIGVSFNDARTIVVDELEDVGEQVVVFGWSFGIPNDGFAVAGDLPDDLKEGIIAAFLDIAGTEEGVELLQELYQIDGFTTVDSADFDPIRELRAELADLLE